MHRHPQWERRLAEFVQQYRSKPYKWGSNDCVTFAANAVKAATGKDYGRGHRGKYKTKLGAAKYLKGMGFDTPEQLIDSLLDEKLPGFAQRGDIVLARDGIPALCMGDFALSVAEGNAGLVRVPRADWVKAWAVGNHHSGASARPGKTKRK